MTGGPGRGLHRHFVDAVQRLLFEEPARPDPEAGATLQVASGASPHPLVADPFQHPRACRSVELQGVTVHYALRRSARRTIGFSVGADGLTVTAPKRAALRDIDKALADKSRWVLAKLADQRERGARTAAAAAPSAWADGATFSHLGQPVRLALGPSDGGGAGDVAAHLDEVGPRRLLVTLPAAAGQAQLRAAVERWLRGEAERVFADRVAHFAGRMGVRVTRLSLSSARTRWGSASTTGAVRLNWRLVHFAPETIDYVVVHELAHLREMNHSARFWAVVRSVLPEFERERRRLRAASPADDAGFAPGSSAD